MTKTFVEYVLLAPDGRATISWSSLTRAEEVIKHRAVKPKLYKRTTTIVDEEVA